MPRRKVFLSRKFFSFQPKLGLSLLTTLICASLQAEAQPDSISHTQLLAASCAACHGQQGNSAGTTPVLAGLASDYFVSRMQAFRDGNQAATVMHHHAKGLTAEEIQQLAIYFSQQIRTTSKPLPQ